MSDIIWAGVVLAALLLGYPSVILHDVSRHQPAPQGPQPDRGGMTAAGVPYVAGR